MGPELSFEKLYGYTEPIRRLIQREETTPQANEIPNTMPSWLPGDDYLINFRKGDPFSKIDQGYARLPGSGYTAIHPELKDTKPENYPDIYKLSILADIAPYSREYNIYRQAVAQQSSHNTQLRIEYEKILERVKETKESAIKMDHRQTRVFFRFPLFATFRIRYDSGPYMTIFNSPDHPDTRSNLAFSAFFHARPRPILPGRIWLDCCSSQDSCPVFLPELKTAPLEGGI